MTLKKEAKKKTIETHRQHTTDTGSSSVQIALLTNRINELTAHSKTHAKDHASRHGLLKMVGQRRRLLNYIKAQDQSKYRKLIDDLKLRR